MNTKPKPLPTETELRDELQAATEHLDRVKLAVAEGTATPDELHDAEKAYQWARTRVTSAAEARAERRRASLRESAEEAARELVELHTGEGAELKKLETELEAKITEYLERSITLKLEHQALHNTILRARDAKALPDGVRCSAAGQAVTVDGTHYVARDGVAELQEWIRKGQHRRAPVSRRKRGQR